MKPSTRAHRAWLLSLVAVLLTWLCACSPEPGLPQATGSSASKPDAGRVLRLGLNIAADSALHAAALRFADEVQTRSRGRLRVIVFADQKLGSDDQMLEMARTGTLDLVLTPTAKLSSAVPAMQYADLPFYFSGREELYAMLDGEPGRLLLSKLGAIDLVGLTFWENGFKQFTANRPIRHPRDFAGLRVRTMKSPLIAEQFGALGAKPIPIDFHATYQALADGAVDAQENPLVAIVGMRFHEVQKHLTISNHAYLGYVFLASKRVFETLAPDLRALIESTARELTAWERAETARREADLLDKVRAAGVTVYTLSSEERRVFSRALSPIADHFGLSVGYDLLGKTEEIRLNGAASTAERGPWILGLDAALSGGSALSGGAIYRGMQLAVDEINAQGGLLGRPVAILARDHAGNGPQGLQNLRHLAAQPSLLAVMGGVHTPVMVAELEEIHRLKLPFLIPWASGHGLTHHGHQPSYTFRVSLNDRQIAPFLLERALKLGRRVAVVLERTAWGRSSEAVLQPLVAALPPGTVDWVWLDVGDPGIGAQVDAVLRRGAEVLVLVTSHMETRIVVQAMAKDRRPVPMISHWGLTTGDFFGPMQPALQKVDLRFVQSTLLDGTQASPRQLEFVNRYRRRYGLPARAPMPAPLATLHAYDLTHLLAQAVRRARSGDREAVRQALENLPPHAGLVQDYAPAFTAGRHDALESSTPRLARFDAGGHIVAVD